MTDAEEQANELLALRSIYEEDNRLHLREEEGKHRGTFTALLSPRQPFILQVDDGGHKAYEDLGGDQKIKDVPVQHLPPVRVIFVLPPDYPSSQAPQFTLSCEWMSKHQFLETEALDHLQLSDHLKITATQYSSKSPLLSFSHSLSSPSSEHHFCRSLHKFENNASDIADPGTIAYAVADVSPVLAALVAYDRDRRHEVFQSSTVLCEICFSSKVGHNCVYFYDCGHAYCKECMCTYFTMRITEGRVTDLKCPHDGCKTAAYPKQVKEVVKSEDYERFEHLFLESVVDSMRDVVYCPRRPCQSPVIVDNDQSSMGRCPACYLVFCTSCRRTYHGLSPCVDKSHELKKLRRKYLRANAEKRRALEKEHGKHTIKQALLEDPASAAWLAGNTKQCPYCGIYIQKVDGCNKVTCSKCHSLFCWLCDALLSRSDPYSHFNAREGGCFQRLFEGARMEEENLLPDYGYEYPGGNDDTSSDDFDQDDDELEDWELDFWEQS